MVAITVAISSGVASMVPIDRLSTFCRVCCWIPILWASAMRLSRPTLVERRTNAQFTELAVADQMGCTPPSSPSELVGSWSAGTPGNWLGTPHGSVPSTVSFGPYPAWNAPASVITFHVDPGCRPGVCVATLYWLVAKSVPPTIALTAPVVGSIATSDETQSEPYCGFALLVASMASSCNVWSKVV